MSKSSRGRSGSKSSGRSKQKSMLSGFALPSAPSMGLAGLDVRRAALLVLPALALLYLIVTSTLPDVWARSHPRLALKLNSSHPVALTALADRRRLELLELSPDEGTATSVAFRAPVPVPVAPPGAPGQPTAAQPPAAAPAPAEGASPPAAPDPTEAAEAARRTELRAEVRSLALRSVEASPLAARGWFLLGETASSTDETRRLMTAAVARARRETGAAFWLYIDAFSRSDYAGMLEQAETIMRSRPNLNGAVVSYLARMAQSDEGREQLVTWLAAPERESVREVVLRTIANYVQDARTPLKLMVDLKARGVGPGQDDLQPYLTFLISKNLVELAYAAWLQFLPAEQTRTIGNVYNPGFELPVTKPPFNWQVSRPRNATAEIRRHQDRRGRGLYVAFESGRVERLNITQVLLLPPGKFKFDVAFRGEIAGRRGLRWRLSCLYDAETVAFQTDMIVGKFPEWQTVAGAFTVPATPECRGQTLALVHDSRSASEQLVTGEAWFDDIHIVADRDVAPAPEAAAPRPQ